MKMTSAAMIAAITGLVGTGFAEARPISYPGGWTLMQNNNGDFASLHWHYSFSAQDSLGLYTERNWTEDWQFTGIQYNRLVKRWNETNSQANLYLKSGLGQVETFDEGGSDLAAFIGVGADWETRRWFTSYEARAYDFSSGETFRQAARIGIAPYIGDYGDLHTWLMLQVENQPESQTTTTLTPLVRFFYGIQLVELGYTPKTERFMANWIVRF